MKLEYWWSDAANAWLVADKATGTLLAQFPDINWGATHIGRVFIPEVIEHNTKQCQWPGWLEASRKDQANG